MIPNYSTTVTTWVTLIAFITEFEKCIFLNQGAGESPKQKK